MENEEESFRLDLKTDPETVSDQALWAGLQPGMRVADIGCGSGKTSSILKQEVGSDGEVIGIDAAEQRIRHARKNYAINGLSFENRDFRQDLTDLGEFDFIWMRFVLEYFRENAFDIVSNITRCLRPGGIICLIDLDHNCMNHYGHQPKLESTIRDIITHLEKNCNFDPYAGRKLYAHMFDLGLDEIQVRVDAHHLIHGELNGVDEFNWMKKLEIAAQNSGCTFDAYDGSYEDFVSDFELFFNNTRRFSYTPRILCRGQRTKG